MVRRNCARGKLCQERFMLESALRKQDWILTTTKKLEKQDFR